MSNGSNTRAFLANLPLASRKAIVENVAKHYGIADHEAYTEITDDEAEHVLDYVTGPLRAQVFAMPGVPSLKVGA